MDGDYLDRVPKTCLQTASSRAQRLGGMWEASKDEERIRRSNSAARSTITALKVPHANTL